MRLKASRHFFSVCFAFFAALRLDFRDASEGAFKSVASSKTLSGIVIDPGLSQRDGQRRHKLIQLAGQRPALLQDLIVGRRAEATQ